jgi:molecular chaperone GrpE
MSEERDFGTTENGAVRPEQEPETVEGPGEAVPPPQAGEEPQGERGGPDANPEKVAELEDRLLRTAAEFENFKRRRAKETADLLRYRSEPLVRDLLPVLDALERAIRSSEGTRDYQAFHDGVEMILQQMREVLARHGVERDDPVEESFDPHRHEAVAMTPSDDVEADHVVEVMEPGYLLYDRVVRPARVVVSSGDGKGSDGARGDDA